MGVAYSCVMARNNDRDRREAPAKSSKVQPIMADKKHFIRLDPKDFNPAFLLYVRLHGEGIRDQHLGELAFKFFAENYEKSLKNKPAAESNLRKTGTEN